MNEELQLAMKLPSEDRLRWAEALFSSVEPAEPPFDAEWIAEATRVPDRCR